MASTNKTTNYELSQFLGTDKPAWLTDYNSDMGKIDSGIHTAQTTATGADGKADANTTAIGTLASLSTDTKTDLVSAINEVDNNADTAQGTATQANTTAGSALLKANANEAEITKIKAQFNLSNSTNLTFSGATFNNNTLKAVWNNDLTLAKIYGRVTISNPTAGAGWRTFTSVETPFSGLNLQNAITIEALGQTFSPNEPEDRSAYAVINTDGSVSIRCYCANTTSGFQTQYFPCLLILQNFGDVPTSE